MMFICMQADWKIVLILYVILYHFFLKFVYLQVCPLRYVWFYRTMYQIKWNHVTGQHGRTVVLLNAITLRKYIWNMKNIKLCVCV